ncbi:MAG: hypothetical protein H6Q52_2727 [Deltaproteobacteria bacterium]|nr:hypothetical protein [Deltaproteobacteria bacterium]
MPLSPADDREKLLGIWKIVSVESEDQATGEREPVLGISLAGYLIFMPEGRMITIATGEDRKEAKTDQDRGDLFESMVAYTGMYRLEGDKFIANVDVAWNPAWVGTEQTRFFVLDGDRLHVTTAWEQSIAGREKGIGRKIVTWERVK